MELNQVNKEIYHKMIGYGINLVRKKYRFHYRKDEIIEYIPEAVCEIVLRFNGAGNLFPYFLTRIDNKITDYIRAHFISRTGKQRDIQTGDSLVDNSYQTLELSVALRTAIGKLPEREKAVITQYYFEDKYFKEIAANLKCSKVTVFDLLNKALVNIGNYAVWR